MDLFMINIWEKFKSRWIWNYVNRVCVQNWVMNSRSAITDTNCTKAVSCSSDCCWPIGQPCFLFFRAPACSSLFDFTLYICPHTPLDFPSNSLKRHASQCENLYSMYSFYNRKETKTIEQITAHSKCLKYDLWSVGDKSCNLIYKGPNSMFSTH